MIVYVSIQGYRNKPIELEASNEGKINCTYHRQCAPEGRPLRNHWKTIRKLFAKPTENYCKTNVKTLCGCVCIQSVFHVFLLPPYSGGEVWQGIWNQTHLVVLNFCLERLHHVTIYHNKRVCFMQKFKNEPTVSVVQCRQNNLQILICKYVS